MTSVGIIKIFLALSKVQTPRFHKILNLKKMHFGIKESIQLYHFQKTLYLNHFVHHIKLKKIYACIGYRKAVIPQLVPFAPNPSAHIPYDTMDVFVVLNS